jgi:hypothetical protein
MNTPTLIIENTGGANLGRCYNASYYKVKSIDRPLADADIEALHDMGQLGYGQEFSFTRGDNEPIDGQPYNKYYVVLATSKCDSSD